MKRKRFNTYAPMIFATFLLMTSFGLTIGTAVQSNTALPIVVAAAAPFYPADAVAAGIEGTVRLRLVTDGRQISEIHVESGQPMLVNAAKENLMSWRLKVHNPTTFNTTFHYKLLSEWGCDLDNSVLVLRLPSQIEISTKRVHTCDPVEEIK